MKKLLLIISVGANCEVVTDGINGFWADNENEWYEKIEILIKDKILREKMGKESVNKIEKEYSVEATKKAFYNLFV